MVRRSVLFSPGDKLELIRKAAESDADVVVFDLEDAVVPADKKYSLEAIREGLNDIESKCEVCVRVNRLGVKPRGTRPVQPVDPTLSY